MGKSLNVPATPNSGYGFDIWSAKPPNSEEETKEADGLTGSVISWFKELFSPQPSHAINFNLTNYNSELTASYKQQGQNWIPIILVPIILAIIIGIFIPLLVKLVKLAFKVLNNKLFGFYKKTHDRLIDDAYIASRISKKEAKDRLNLLRDDLIKDLHKGISDYDEYRVLERKITKYNTKLDDGAIYRGKGDLIELDSEASIHEKYS